MRLRDFFRIKRKSPIARSAGNRPLSKGGLLMTEFCWLKKKIARHIPLV